MNPILLRNDGPIENDIKPYYLDGKDIKTALEDIKNSLLFFIWQNRRWRGSKSDRITHWSYLFKK